MSVKHPEYLEAEIVLDNPEYLHHGNGKAVTGHLALTYHCVESASELSGVLIASVLFRGRTKAEIKIGQGSKWTSGSSTWYGKLTPYTSEDILFDFSREIHNGPFRATCNKTRPVNSKGWDPTKLLSSQVDEQLPPSSNCKYEYDEDENSTSVDHRFALHYPLHLLTPFRILFLVLAKVRSDYHSNTVSGSTQKRDAVVVELHKEVKGSKSERS
ncbi:hypothetical protein LTR95_008375 [Oleoguttula sp. CCFEE 5521]